MRAETGPIGGNLSHEFIILAQTGESEVFCHRDYLDFAGAGRGRRFRRRGDPASDRRQMDRALCRDRRHARRRRASRRSAPDKRVSARGIEVGQIFYFGTKYSEPMKAVVATGDGAEVPVHMGSYGIGVVAAGRRHHRGLHDDAGIIWPEPVAPFKVGHPQPEAGRGRHRCAPASSSIASSPPRASTCSIDDLDERPGAKFATADLIGIPWQMHGRPARACRRQGRGQERADGSRDLMSPAAAIDLLGALTG